MLGCCKPHRISNSDFILFDIYGSSNMMIFLPVFVSNTLYTPDVDPAPIIWPTRHLSKMFCLSLPRIFFGDTCKIFRRYYSLHFSISAWRLPFSNVFSSIISENCLGESMTSSSPPQIIFSADDLLFLSGFASILSFPLDLQLEFFLRCEGSPSGSGCLSLWVGLFCSYLLGSECLAIATAVYSSSLKL
jgi:hypothetical protein